jgi:hypothetical protein
MQYLYLYTLLITAVLSDAYVISINDGVGRQFDGIGGLSGGGVVWTYYKN